ELARVGRPGPVWLLSAAWTACAAQRATDLVVAKLLALTNPPVLLPVERLAERESTGHSRGPRQIVQARRAGDWNQVLEAACTVRVCRPGTYLSCDVF